MQTTSILFFSSSSIALPLFRALLKDARFRVLGLVCQPDREAGRGQNLTAAPTKVLALEHHVPVFQPEKLRADALLLQSFEEQRPDFLLTFAYGQILSEHWLKIPLREALNVHPSLLPLYRGPAPIEAALLHGDKETGITLMRMVQAMDSGPLAFQHVFSIPEMCTAGELFDEVARRAAEWIPNDIATLVQEPDFPFSPQNETLVVSCNKVEKEDAYENFDRSAEELLRRFQAYTPRPGLWTTFLGKRIKLLKLKASTERLTPGLVTQVEGRVFIGTQSSAVELLECQQEGKQALSAHAFIQGTPLFTSSTLPS